MKKMVLFLVLLPAMIHARAAFPYNAQTSLSRSETYVGQTVYLTFSVQTEEKPVLQPLRNVYGLKIEYMGENVGTQMTTTIVNGRRNSKTVYNYRYTYAVTPIETGTFIIPQTVITAGSSEYKTSPVKLTVKEIGKNENFRLILTPDCGDRAYRGQTVTLSVEMEISSNIDSLEITIPFPENSVLLSPDSAGNPSDSGNVKINDAYYPFKRETAVRDRALFSAQVRFIVDFPGESHSAEFDYGKATASFRAVTATRESVDMFGRTVEDRQYAPVVIPAEQGKLLLLDLPEPRPADFAGIVGKPRLTASADMSEAYVGDPVTYRLTIEGAGNGNIETVPLNKIGDFSSRFRIPEHHSPPLKENGKTVFVYTIRPLSSAVTEIPAYRCSYFNPETERYETAETKPLPLKVNPSPDAGDSQIEEFSAGTNIPDAVSLERLGNRVPAAAGGDRLLRRENRFPYRTVYRLLYGLAYPITLLPLVAAVVCSVRRRNPQSRRERVRAMKKALAALRNSDSPERMMRLFRLTEEYKDLVAESPACGREVDHLKKILFSGGSFSSEECDSVSRKIEEALR